MVTEVPVLAQFCEVFFYPLPKGLGNFEFTVQNRKVHSFCRKTTACAAQAGLSLLLFICFLWGSTAALTSCPFSPSCVCSGLCYCSNAQGITSSCSGNRLGTAALCLLAQNSGKKASGCCGLICFGLLLPIFFLNKTLGVFGVSICKLLGKDRLLLLKVWPLCTISGVPVLPMCTCDLEHWDSIASSIVLQKTVSHSKVQTLLQRWALSSPLCLCWGYLWRMGFSNVSTLVPVWLLLALLSHPLSSFFFPSLLPIFDISVVYWLRVHHRCCVIHFSQEFKISGADVSSLLTWAYSSCWSRWSEALLNVARCFTDMSFEFCICITSAPASIHSQCHLHCTALEISGSNCIFLVSCWV